MLSHKVNFNTFKRIEIIQNMFSNKVSRKISLRKEMEIFIWAWFEDHNPERVSQKALRTVLPIRSQYTVTEEFFWDRELYIKRCITDILHNLDLSVALYQERMLSLRSCLKRMLLLVFEWKFLSVGNGWLIQIWIHNVR